MIGDYKNSMKIIDYNNEEEHEINFHDQATLYDGEMFIIDVREMGFDIADSLASQMEAYEWDEVDRDDIVLEVHGWLQELTAKLESRVEEVLKENEIPYEV